MMWLPFFHSFGYLGTIWWPLLTGIPTAFHANPLQPAVVDKRGDLQGTNLGRGRRAGLRH